MFQKQCTLTILKKSVLTLFTGQRIVSCEGRDAVLAVLVELLNKILHPVDVLELKKREKIKDE
jgi:hypothetical protein